MKVLMFVDMECEISDKATEYLTPDAIENIAKENVLRTLKKTKVGIIKGDDPKPVVVRKLVYKTVDKKEKNQAEAQ